MIKMFDSPPIKRLLLLLIILLTSSSTIIPITISTNACPKNQVIFQNTCILQINGCISYKTNSMCNTCDKRYLLINGTCLESLGTGSNNLVNQSQLDFKLSDGLFITQDDILKFKLTLKQVISFNYTLMFIQNSTQIISILKTPYETFFSWTMLCTENQKYLFQVSINSSNSIILYLSQLYTKNLETSLFSSISNSLLQKSVISLKLLTITTISKNLFKLYFITDHGVQYVSFVQKNPVFMIKTIELANITINQNSIMAFVYIYLNKTIGLNYIFIQKPAPSNTSRQFQINIPNMLEIIIRLNTINNQMKTIFYLQSKNSQSLPQSQPNILGGLHQFKNKSDLNLQKVIKFLLTQFDFLQFQNITKVQYQIVAGTIFYVHLRDVQDDQYVCKIFYSLTGMINVMDIYLNNVLIHTQPLAPIQDLSTYDYRNDTNIKIVKDFLLKKLQIPINRTISYVNRAINPTNLTYTYTIVYSYNSYINLQLNVSTSIITLLDIILDGTNIAPQNQLIQIKPQLISYLSLSQPLLNPLIIVYIKQTKPDQYFIKVLSGQGSYFYKVKWENGMGNILYYQLVDENQTYLTMSIDDINQYVIDHTDVFDTIKTTNKQLQKAQITSITQSIINELIQFNIIYTYQANNKQYEVVLTQNSSSNLIFKSINQIIL